MLFLSESLKQKTIFFSVNFLFWIPKTTTQKSDAVTLKTTPLHACGAQTQRYVQEIMPGGSWKKQG